jgi:hypothetical protein
MVESDGPGTSGGEACAQTPDVMSILPSSTSSDSSAGADAGIRTPISIDAYHVPSTDPSLPALVVQVTKLTGSYMLWVGASSDAAAGGEDPRLAVSAGMLGRDWACAMPSMNVCVLCALFEINGHVLSTSRLVSRVFQRQERRY